MAKKGKKKPTRSPERTVRKLLQEGAHMSDKPLERLSLADLKMVGLHMFSALGDSERDYFTGLENGIRTNTFTDHHGEKVGVDDAWDRILFTIGYHFNQSPEKLLLGRIIRRIGLIGSGALSSQYAANYKQLDPGQQAVKDYLWCVEKMYEGAIVGEDAIRDLDGKGNLGNGVKMARRLWTVLRQARIFEVKYDDWAAIVHQGTNDFMKVIGLDTFDHDEIAPFSEEDATAVWDLIEEYTITVNPKVKSMPFENIFIGFESPTHDGWSWTGELKKDRLEHVNLAEADVMRLRLAGYLVTPTEIVEMMVVHPLGESAYLLPRTAWKGGMWGALALLNQFFVPPLIASIEDHRTFTEHKPTFGMRQRMKRQSSADGKAILPRPYYTIKLKPTRIIEEMTLGNGPGRVLTHRYDRSAHERCYVRRGPLPLEPKDAKKLEGYGYRIYTLKQPSADDMFRLAKRGMKPKGPKEWLAIKHRNIDSMVIGPDHLPYVPAVRVS